MRRYLCLSVVLLLVVSPLLCGCRYYTKQPKRYSTKNASGTKEWTRSKIFAASVFREPFHYISCPLVTKIDVQNLVGYDSGVDAIADGHRSCEGCNP